MSTEDEWEPSDDDVDEDAVDEQEGQEEADDEEALELRDDLEDNFIDPFSLAERMGAHEVGSDAQTVKQPFEILAESARAQHAGRAASSDEDEPGRSTGRKKGVKKGKGGFGARVADIWDEDLGEADMDLDMEIGLSAKSRKKQRARQKRRRKALAEGRRTKEPPEEVKTKLGQANLQYALGRYDEAVVLLKEVLKLAPHLRDPYFTLGKLYEAAGNTRQALNMFMIAAHLTPKDVDLWRRLATLSLELSFHRQAIYCLSKVITRDPNDVHARWERARLFMDLGEVKKALPEFEKIAALNPGDPETPKMLAHLYHGQEQPRKAMEVLEKHLREQQLSTDFTHANMLAELYMEDRQFEKAFQLIRNTIALYCPGDTEIPLDLQVKASICLLHEGKMEEAKPGLRTLEATEVEGVQDLFQEAADALLDNGYPEQALEYFTRLHERKLGGPDLWKKLAACYKGQHDPAGAAKVYLRIVESVQGDGTPSFPVESRVSAALALAELHQENGQESEAREALDMLDDLGHLDLGVLNRTTELLLKMGDQEGYLDVMMPQLEEALKQAAGPKQGRKRGMTAQAKRRKQVIANKRNREEQSAVFKGYVTRDRRKPHVREADERLAREMEAAEEEPEELPDKREGAVLFGNLGRDQAQFDALVKTARVLMACGKPLQASELLAECLSRLTKRSTDKSKKDTLRWLAAEAALMAGEPALALFHLRFACESSPYSYPMWNMFCEAATDLGSVKQAQKAAYFLKHTVDCIPLKLVHGHSLAINNAHGRALAEYMSAYNSDPHNPLILLCIGVAHLNQAVSRKVPDRDRAVLAAFAFLEVYARKRHNKQEVFYNFGRAAHQVGLLQLAANLYCKALAAEVPPALEKRNRIAKAAPPIDLSREIAHNLVLLLRSTGNDGMARDIMRRYLTIR